jgi:hypothetical protein
MIKHAMTFDEFRKARIKRAAKCNKTITKLCEPERHFLCEACYEHVVVEQLNQK